MGGAHEDSKRVRDLAKAKNSKEDVQAESFETKTDADTPETPLDAIEPVLEGAQLNQDEKIETELAAEKQELDDAEVKETDELTDAPDESAEILEQDDKAEQVLSDETDSAAYTSDGEGVAEADELTGAPKDSVELLEQETEQVLTDETDNATDAREDDLVAETENRDAENAEVVSEEASDTIVEEPQPVAPPPVVQKSSIWPAVFGGIVAAVIGFVAGRGDQLDAYLPASLQRQTADLTPLVDQASALEERIAQLETEPPNQDPAPSLEAFDVALTDIEGVKFALSELAERVEEMGQQVETIEARPVETVETIVQQPIDNTQNAEEIASLQSAVQTLQSQIAQDEARAKSEAERLLAQAALTRVVTAVESGETFEPALSALEEVTPIDVPDALRIAAAEGVPSMSFLRENFPDAARAGLAATRAEVPETEVGGVGDFFRRQLSIRSVTPREGDDADAVLSRAEAALNAEDLEGTLVELDALPEVAKAAMQGWLDGAAARQDARQAAQEMADSLTVN